MTEISDELSPEERGLENFREPYHCKITVLRKDFHEDLYAQYPYGWAQGCGRLEVGQEFITENRWDPPLGFCAWAWGDLRPMIQSIHAGHEVTMIACCTDGLRPVTFKLERVGTDIEQSFIPAFFNPTPIVFHYEINIMNTFLHRWAESNGNKLKIIPISRLQDLKTEIDDFKNTEELNDFQKWIVNDLYQFDVPKVDFPVRSIILLAITHPFYTNVEFVRGTKTYLTSGLIVPDFDQVKKDLSHLLATQGYHLRRTSILPLKRLAVQSGLAVYGRNNICYVEGMGSIFSLAGYYSDVYSEDDYWGDIRQAERCVKCLVCIDNCPTGALRQERFLIDNERCLSNHNESEGEFPEWLPITVHHCLYDCLKCQVVCPMNRPYLNNMPEPVLFSEEETEMLLNGRPTDEFSPDMMRKVKLLGLDQYLEIMPRNLKVLFELSDRQEKGGR